MATAERDVEMQDDAPRAQEGDSVAQDQQATDGNGVSGRSGRSRRRRTRSRRQQHHRPGSVRYEKALLHFGAAQILIGIVCVLLQMVQFKNHSILSETQPGLWCGTVFAITGAVCIALARTTGVYSVIAMLCFSIVSLFMALTLASLSWFGAEMAVRCEAYYEYYCIDSTTAPMNYNGSTTTVPAAMPFIDYTSTSLTTTTSNDTSTETPPNYPTCSDIENGYCGYDISLGRTMHSLLMLAGVVGATTSFVLATLACSRPNEIEGRLRYPSIYTVHGSDVPAGVRPITAWEFPPPSKDPLPLDNDPMEPPPPYEEVEVNVQQTQL